MDTFTSGRFWLGVVVGAGAFYFWQARRMRAAQAQR